MSQLNELFLFIGVIYNVILNTCYMKYVLFVKLIPH